REKIRLGNVHASRDWGHARDYVRAMRLMVEGDRRDDYVIATGDSDTVAAFAEVAFALVGLNWMDFVIEDPALRRPADPEQYCGDASRAARDLGWAPTVSFEELVAEMLEADLTAHGLDPTEVRGPGAL